MISNKLSYVLTPRVAVAGSLSAWGNDINVTNMLPANVSESHLTSATFYFASLFNFYHSQRKLWATGHGLTSNYAECPSFQPPPPAQIPTPTHRIPFKAFKTKCGVFTGFPTNAKGF